MLARLNSPIWLIVLPLIFSACSALRTREQVRESVRRTQPPGAQSQQPATPGSVSTPPPSAMAPDTTPDEEANVLPPQQSEAPISIPPRNVPDIPKIGIILGPGGALTYAHIGMLHELQKEKIPVHSIAGMEWGAPIAALFSIKGLANEAEWQMMKLKTDEVLKKALISGQVAPQPVENLLDFLKTSLGNAKAENSRLPFACPALNLAKNQLYLMSRGSFDQMLPFCLPYPPLLKSYQGNVAGLRDVKAVADHLRSRGANWIVFVNVLPPPSANKPFAGTADSAEALLWNELAAQFSKPMAGVDQVWNLNLDDGLLNFDAKREILQKGAERSVNQIRQSARRWGL